MGAPARRGRKKLRAAGFGQRLREARKSRGMTQAELGDAVGTSNRMISYYERTQANPPGPLLTALANILGVSVEQLLGTKLLREKPDPKSARIMKRLQQVEQLPPPEQRAVLKFVEGLLARRMLAKEERIARGRS